MTKGEGMNRMSRLRLLPALASLLLLGAVSTTGCSKRVTSVDAGYTTVEGISNANARLVAWRETPITYITYRDTAFGDITKFCKEFGINCWKI